MHNATKLIFYIDDDADDCIFLKSSLEDNGSKANLICSNDGEEAVNYLKSITGNSLPSLIVLDLNMPGWDGHKTLHCLKSNPQLAGIPVVIFSTHESEKEKEICHQLGAASYFKKPNRYDEYKGVVAHFFSVMA